MVKMFVDYVGDLHCNIKHGPSHTVISTDAPADNMGKGESFSPTDLIGAALASCIATTINIFAKRKGWDFSGMRLEVEKIMHTGPDRRIAKLPVKVWMPFDMSSDDRKALERVAHSCPVNKSMSSEVDIPITFYWGKNKEDAGM